MYLGLANIEFEDNDFGCSSFLAKTQEGDYLAGRNYDFSESEELVFYTNPSDGFASIGMTELRAMGIGDNYGIAPDSFIGKATLLCAPYCTMDGVNEKGVMVSVLQLNLGGIHQDNGKPDIGLWVAIRLILDRAESTDHAIRLLEQYDIHDVGAYAHHLFISDSTGNSVVVEWKGNEMIVDKNQPTATNFRHYIVIDKSSYKGGCTRYDTIIQWLTNHSSTTAEQAMNVLESISKNEGGYPTQWSSVYYLNNFCVDVTIDRNYNKFYHFTADDFN